MKGWGAEGSFRMVPWGPSIAEARHGGPSILSLVNLLELGELGHVQMKDLCSELSLATGREIAPAPKPFRCCRRSEGVCTLLCSYIPLCTSAPGQPNMPSLFSQNFPASFYHLPGLRSSGELRRKGQILAPYLACVSRHRGPSCNIFGYAFTSPAPG